MGVPSSSVRGQVALFIAVFGFFLLTGSREKPWGDATPIWEVAESLVRRGDLNIPTAWPPDLPRGRDGRIYAVAPLVQSLVHVPGAFLRYVLGQVAPQSAPYTTPFFSHLGPALLGATLCSLFFGFLRRQGVRDSAAFLGTAVLAVGTTIWVYARSPYGEAIQAVAFLGLFDAVLRMNPESRRRDFARVGAWAGLLLATKPVYAAAWPGVILLVARASRGRAWGFGWLGLSALPFVVLILGYNVARFGSPFNAGYVLKPSGDLVRLSPFGERLWLGLWGLFLSPGKSVFLYSPPLLLSLVSLRFAWQRWRSGCWTLLALAGPVVLIYGTFLFWAGDYAWGPRYLVFVVAPVWASAVIWLDAEGWQGRPQRWAVMGVVVVGIWVQILGIAFFWDHFIRISHDVATRWLGTPDRTGAATATHDGLCGACFEDTHGLQWLPAFQPMMGHWWMLRHVVAGDDWTVASASAPWRRYTTLSVDAKDRWNQVRLDWWFADLRVVHEGAAFAMLVGFAAMTAGGVGVVLRRRKRGATTL